MARRIALTAIDEVWGDGRITVYRRGKSGKHYVEFLFYDQNNNLRGIFAQLTSHYGEPNAVITWDKDKFISYSRCKVDMRNRPRVACDYMTAHSIQGTPHEKYFFKDSPPRTMLEDTMPCPVENSEVKIEWRILNPPKETA